MLQGGSRTGTRAAARRGAADQFGVGTIAETCAPARSLHARVMSVPPPLPLLICRGDRGGRDGNDKDDEQVQHLWPSVLDVPCLQQPDVLRVLQQLQPARAGGASARDGAPAA